MTRYYPESQGNCDKLKETGTRDPPEDGIQCHGCFARSKFLSLDTLKGLGKSAFLMPQTYGQAGGRQGQA